MIAVSARPVWAAREGLSLGGGGEAGLGMQLSYRVLARHAQNSWFQPQSHTINLGVVVLL